MNFHSAIIAAAASFMFTGSTFAGSFEDVCPDKTAAMHPDVEDPEAVCSCVASSASDDILEQLINATGPDDAGDEAKEILSACLAEG